MKLNKKLLAKYNQPDTIAVVSLYPKKGEIYSSGASGVASYSKNVVRHMNSRVLVLADKWGREKAYEEDDSLVLRVWSQNHKKMWMEIISALESFSKIKTVLIHFDFSMYGGMVTSGLMLPFLALLKILGYQVSVVSHHVIRDVKPLSGQVGLGVGIRGLLKGWLYNSVFSTFYWLLGKVCQKVIVLEETLKERLTSVMATDQVIAIPHAVDTELKQPTKACARKRLGYGKNEAVVLFFGYVNWFKGADFFAKTFASMKTLVGKKARFVIAGGESPTLKDKGYYQTFFNGVEKAIKRSHGVEMTGYVPQEKIADYFAAADLVVFPYREFMCASGVLAQTFAYKKPFIVSNRLGKMFAASDLNQAMRQVQLRKADVTFTMEEGSLQEVTERVLENGLKQKLRLMTHIVSENRGFAATAPLYEAALQPLTLMQETPKIKGDLLYAVEQ